MLNWIMEYIMRMMRSHRRNKQKLKVLKRQMMGSWD
jgi:flagellar biogenesis protein FliO